ncbi:MAG: S-layer homology domain-containing protein, partial [Oscillospiraceae bacterium]|nr:S-layer homology domain-containing protein [Oscillospiraceae bacterium]
KDAEYAIGCIGGRLVENGNICSGFEAGSAPRTAVGIKADGQVVFYTIDGRQQGYSHGVTLDTLAWRMAELGCVDAVNLDGGGSTVIAGIYPGSSTLSVINSPSDGSLRKSANYIFLRTKSAASNPVPIPETTPTVIPTISPDMLVNPTAEPELTHEPEAAQQPDNTVLPTGTPETVKIDISETAAPDASETAAIPPEEPDYPEIKAEYSDHLITASVITSSDTADVSLFTDGIDCTDKLSKSDSGKIITYKTDDDFDVYTHRIKITATASDGRSAVEYITTRCEQGYKNIFIDTSNHWALEYISYMSDKGIVHGDGTGGKIFFRPQNNMTRAEFAVMMSNSMHTDTAEFNDIPDFEDIDSIPSWAIEHIAAMYSKGIINGRNSETGIYFDPDAPITRAEAMTIISRTLPDGMKARESNFADSEEIPVWAVESINKLVCMGAVSGYTDNTIMPNKKITRAEGVKLLYEVY